MAFQISKCDLSTSQWDEWTNRDLTIATQIFSMHVWQWKLQNKNLIHSNNLIHICINEDLTKSLHGSQATRLKNTTKGHRVECEEETLRKTFQTLSFVWLGATLSITDHIFMICLYEGSHTHDNNIKKGTVGGGVILTDIHRWIALDGKRPT